MLLSLFFGSFFVALSGALMPGPLLSATLAESGRRGASAGPLMILGHGILEALLVAALFAGLAPWLKSPQAFGAIALAGAVILFNMGRRMITTRSELTLDFEVKESRFARLGPVASGALMSLANPYWSIWWATIGLGYLLSASEAGLVGVVAFFTGHILADLLWYAAVSFSMARGKQFLSLNAYRGLVGSLGLFLIFFAAYFAYSGTLRFLSLYA